MKKKKKRFLPLYLTNGPWSDDIYIPEKLENRSTEPSFAVSELDSLTPIDFRTQDQYAMTLKEISETLNISVVRVHKIIENALLKIKNHYNKNKFIKDFLE